MKTSSKRIAASIVAASLLFAGVGTALSQTTHRYPNTKGLSVEAMHPAGYQSLAARPGNQIIQLARQNARGHIFFLQLSVYEYPSELVADFRTVSAEAWATDLLDEKGDVLISSVVKQSGPHRSIDIVHDQDLMVGPAKWRSRHATRWFEVGGRIVAIECVTSAQYTSTGIQPPNSVLASLRNEQVVECDNFMDGVKVSG